MKRKVRLSSPLKIERSIEFVWPVIYTNAKFLDELSKAKHRKNFLAEEAHDFIVSRLEEYIKGVDEILAKLQEI